MITDAHRKVTAHHLARDAYLYVRQSSLRQVVENTESTRRQYDLRQRAVALGWPQDRIVVIDSDLGQSGASAKNRGGFQQLVSEVGLGHAGIVMGLEVSRLARNNADWHRLLEICALTDTLLLDEDGVYDPAHFNDRLLLGLKGTMSEAELHMLRLRLQGGILNKARRGELRIPLPIGLAYEESTDRIILDPDKQVRESLGMLFRTFARTGSAMATVKEFRRKGLLFPRRVRYGPNKGEVLWGELTHWRVLRTLHNPRYAGAFAYGRCRARRGLDGRIVQESVPREEWIALVPNAHIGYITWEEHETNLRQLRDNSAAYAGEGKRSPPREGPALLQGVAICGKCGQRMTVRYRCSHGHLLPNYVCQREGIAQAEPICASIPGASIDRAIGELLVETVTPLALEVSLAVQEELQAQLDDADRLRKKRVEGARYQAELAQRRYMRVDPDNRLVADSLEADWNEKLRALTDAQEEYERKREEDRKLLDDEQRRRILALASDFPRLWQDPATPFREKKRMVRLLIEDATLRKEETLTVHVRFRGGATRTLALPRPVHAGKLRQTPKGVVEEIHRLLDQRTDGEIAERLNQQALRSGEGKPFHRLMVRNIRRTYGLKSRYDRLRDAGMLTLEETAEKLDVCTDTVKIWRRAGLLRAHRYSEKNEFLYEPPGNDAPIKKRWKGLSGRRRIRKVIPDRTCEVQCEA
jgi:DNA invertase Pin-like site-specific DNA recombinase